MRKIDEEKIKEKNRAFWKLMNIIKLRVRITRQTAAVLWADDNYVDIDFWDDIYYVDVHKDDLRIFKQWLRANKVACVTGTDEKLKEKRKQRPLIMLTAIDKFSSEIKSSFPIIPLKEFVQWCKGRQPMENILEYVDMRFDLGLGIRCSDEECRAIMEKSIVKQRNKEKRKAERYLKMFWKNSDNFG
jgi:hypothetical protein